MQWLPSLKIDLGTRMLAFSNNTDTLRKNESNHSPSRYGEIVGNIVYFDLRPGQTYHSKDSGSDTSQWPLIERNRAGELG